MAAFLNAFGLRKPLRSLTSRRKQGGFINMGMFNPLYWRRGTPGEQVFGPAQLQQFHTRSSNAWFLDGSQGFNAIPESENIVTAKWLTTNGVVSTLNPAGVTPPAGVGSVTRLDYTGSNSYFQWVATGYPGVALTNLQFTFSIWLWTNTPGKQIGLRVCDGGPGTDTTATQITLTATPTRYSVSRTFLGNSGNTNISADLDNRVSFNSDGLSGTVFCAGAQINPGLTADDYRPTFGAMGTRLSVYGANVLRVVTAPDGASAALREPGATNLIVRSQDFETWANPGATLITVTANNAVAPDGSITADYLSRAPLSNSYLSTGPTAAAGTITYSIYVKKGTVGGNFVALRIQGTYPNRGDAVFDLANGLPGATANGGTATGVTSRMEYVRDGWFRCIVSVALADALTSVLVSPCDSSSTPGGFEGAGTPQVTSDCFVWGAQCEVNVFATSYIPTAGATVTRAIDAIYDPAAVAAGQPYSLAVDYCMPPIVWTGVVGTARITGSVQIGIGSGSDGTMGAYNGLSLSAANKMIFGARQRVAYAGDSSGRSMCVNGSAIVSDANTHGAFTGMELGTQGGTTNSVPLFIHEYRKAPRRWGAGTLKSLTSLANTLTSVALPTLQSNFTRPSPAWAFDANGVLQQYTSGVMRYCPAPSGAMGVLIEDMSTNFVRNSVLSGAVIGGAYPTNWQQEQGFGAVITPTVTGTGVEFGMNYVELRFNGSLTGATNHWLMVPEGGTAGGYIAAAPGDKWCNSWYVRLVAGVAPGVTVSASVEILDNANTSVGATSTANSGNPFLTPTLTRLWASAVGANAGTTRMRFRMGMQPNASTGTFDFTVRVYMPQSEQQGYPTSPIPTSGAAVTRLQDAIGDLPFDKYVGRDQGTFYGRTERPSIVNIALSRSWIADVMDGGSNRLALRANDSVGVANAHMCVGNGAANATVAATDATQNVVNERAALSWDRTGTRLGRLGSNGSTTTVWGHAGVAEPKVISLGGLDTGSSPSLHLNGWLTAFSVSKSAMSAETLAELTA